MILKDVNKKQVENLFNKYKEDYNPIINDFTHIYAYKKNNTLVAFLIFNIMYEKCEIVDIYVLEEYRRNHIAESLINELVNNYKLDNITLEVSEKNISAIKLYEKLGFKKVALRKNYYKDSDGLLMLKEVR